MLGIDVTFKTVPLPELEAFYEQIQQTVQKVGDLVVDADRDEVIEAMARYPQKAVHPFQFATAKSRRFYFWLVRTGRVKTDGTRYLRNGQYARSWKLIGEMRAGRYVATILTTWDGAKWVGGTLVKNVSQARKPQVAGHKRTGWQLSSVVAQKQYEMLAYDFAELFEDEIGSQFAQLNTRRRAFSK